MAIMHGFPTPTDAPAPPPTGGAEERHRAMLASMLDPLVLAQPVRDAAGRVVDFVYAEANPAACAWIGLDHDRLVGRRMLDLYPQLATTGLMRRFAETAETGRPTVAEEFPFEPDGRNARRMDVRAVRADAWVSFVWRDVTERHEAVARIAAVEEQFRLMAENSHDVVVRIGMDDRILWVSPSVTPVLGWAAVDCIGRPGAEFLATDESRAQYLRDKARVAAGEGVVSRARIRSAAGTTHWVEVHTSPYKTQAGTIDGMVATLRIVDAEVMAGQALDRRARTDELTDLPNRKEVFDRLGGLSRHGGRGVAVLWCDIDRFKAVNDSHGHAAGDVVLRALAGRIRGALRSGDDIAARIGGDELLVVLRGVHGLDDAVAVAETLRHRAAEPITLADGTVRATLSIGVTVAGDEERVDAVLARADEAMYRAKAAGRDRVVALAPPGDASDGDAAGT
jgi:diguanylate cyclase (GGDEF)-like protein/PAS domain S-box-containing protein